MKILIIPDVHGRTFWRKAVDMVDKYNRIIFLGDYLDPYPEEGVTRAQADVEFHNILKFKRAYPNKVSLLLGNHDLHYISQEFPESTRIDSENWSIISEKYKKHLKLFSVFKYIKAEKAKLLFSHAGVLKKWLANNEIELSKLTRKQLGSLITPLGQVSYFRGGWYPCGSPVWADVHEGLKGGMILDGYFQIFGHTRASKAVEVPGGVMIDTQCLWELDTKTMELNPC